MPVRSLIIIVICAGVVESSAAQAQRAETRDHPEMSATVVWRAPAASQGIYRTDDELLFESGDVVRRVRVEGTVMAVRVSPSGRQIGALIKDSDAAPLRLRVFTQEGEPAQTYELPHHRDDPLPQIAISDASIDAVFARPATAEVCFLQEGEADCVALFKDADYTHERNVYVDVSPDGRYVAVAAQREPVHPAMSASDVNAYLFLFDGTGMMLWRRALPQPAVRALAFSPSSLVAVSTYDAYAPSDVLQRSRVVTVDGVTVAEAPYGADSFVFGSDEILLNTSQRVAALNVAGRTSRVVYDAEPGRQIVSSAAGQGRAASVLLTGRRMFSESGFAFADLRLLHLDAEGRLVGDDAVSAPPQHAPRVAVDMEADRSAVILNRESHFYIWPR